MLEPMTELRRLVLWDIDGTLLSAGPTGRAVFDEAVEEVVGRLPGDHGVQMSGKTDPQIALEILASLAITGTEADERLPGVLQALEERLEGAIQRMRADGRVMPGVEQVLAGLSADPSVLQTVLTGNMAGNARVKLKAFGLDRWLDLDVAATGTDDADRTRLVPVALDKVRRKYAADLAPEDVWVVGETPLDLACARAAGAHCLLAATGRFQFDQLQPLEADAVMRDLSDTEAVLGLLAGTRTTQ